MGHHIAFVPSAFQPTLPLRGATWTGAAHYYTVGVSTHAPLAGSDDAGQLRDLAQAVSTHAPLAGSDNRCAAASWDGDQFQPTLPLRGATSSGFERPTSFAVFQPTLPLRGATVPRDGSRPHGLRFNPRSPCGERHRAHRVHQRERVVSTHAPLAGSDILLIFCPLLCLVSTHAPLAGSDGAARSRTVRDRVSTHAPLAGSDGTPR